MTTIQAALLLPVLLWGLAAQAAVVPRLGLAAETLSGVQFCTEATAGPPMRCWQCHRSRAPTWAATGGAVTQVRAM